MRINSSTKPLTEVKKSAESAIKMANQFKELFNSKLR
jgi:DNA-directed RNA polymerase subunit L